MNFYKHHIGDYAAATAHLTFTEDAAFTRLLRIYYRDERPLPVEVRAVQRLAGARMPEELEAVETVLREFFTLSDDGWHNKRCDEEISAFKEMEADAAAKRENEAERQRRHRERRKELFDELRALGVVPAYDVPTSELESMLSRQRTQQVTRTATAIQTPDSINQTPLPEKPKQKSSAPKTTRLPPDWFLPRAWGQWAEQERPDLDVRREAEIFRDYWVAVGGAKGCKADWEATWRNWIRKADGMRRRAEQRAEPSKRMQGLMRLEELKNGGLGTAGNHHGDAATLMLGARSGAGFRLGGGNGSGMGGGGET